ncbi:4-amino-4-deoxychorismate lyase [Soonwooa buanensis]|uniref:4-amino-4-deoxychorismate lyase n=1 Tax=Soonwooa buanensis TaxID=619805 RepID=A0A1T5FUX7_9FLAO|nr:aminotransferase class IV [Soonwooa buanensis]SKB99930.1 4-amino-4-deoxychorismate lyase [Soonwooa buanensis]
MLQFIESIKVEDQKIFLAELHQQRIIETFSHFEKDCRIDVLEVFENLNHDEDGLYKFRLVYDLENNIKTQMLPYAISEIEDFELVTDDNLNYQFKYFDRKNFDHLKQKSQADEVIILQNGNVTDTCFSNLLFLKDKTWYTPETYLLNGVQRQHLLKQNQIKSTAISVDNILEFSHFQIINALNDFDENFIYPISKIKNLPSKILDIDDL